VAAGGGGCLRGTIQMRLCDVVMGVETIGDRFRIGLNELLSVAIVERARTSEINTK